jgi:hypothetical protein
VRTLKRGGTYAGGKPPILTLIRRSDGQTSFLVRENIQNLDDDFTDYGDGSVILCTDDYGIYNDIDECDGIDGHLAVNHSETYVIIDAHINTCENRHSFLRQWLGKFRGVLKRHLQKYLDFLALRLTSRKAWFEEILCYDVSG